MAASLFRYLTQISMFSALGSSDKSNMWELKRGSPCALKYSSSAATMPSNQGSSFLAQWSEWTGENLRVSRSADSQNQNFHCSLMTGIPYAPATARMK